MVRDARLLYTGGLRRFSEGVATVDHPRQFDQQVFAVRVYNLSDRHGQRYCSALLGD